MTSSATALTITNVSKRFGGLQALKNVSFNVPTGAIVGLIGPNGAGKSTLFQIISGDQSPNSGTVAFYGDDVTSWPNFRRRRSGLSRTFQNVRLFETMTAEENIAVSALECGDGNFRRETQRILDLLGIRSIGDRVPSELTLADRKKIEIGRAMAGRCRVLLLDESLSGLTHDEAGQMTSVIRDLNRQIGLTIIVVEHVIPVVMSLAQRLIVLQNGEVIADGEPAAVARDERVISAYLGTKHAHPQP